MRIWIVVVVSMLVGLAIGLGTTIAEFGFWPGGSSGIEFGPLHTGPTPPPLSAEGPPPKVEVEGNQSEFDFGRADKDTPQQHDFVIRNVGKGNLTLLMGTPTCLCTKAEIENPNVPPGGSTKVTLAWKPKTLGKFRQSAPLLTNDPENRSIDLIVSGEIVSNFSVERDRVVFTGISSIKPATDTVRILSFAAANLELIRPEFSNPRTAPLFDVVVERMSDDELKQEVGAKSGCILRITVKPGLPAGRFEQRIQLHSNLQGDPEIAVTVEGKVTSPIEVVSRVYDWDAERGILMLGQVRSSEGAKAELFLTIGEGAQDKVDLKLAEPAPEPLTVTIGKLKKLTPSTARIPLDVEVRRGARPVDHLGNEQGKLARLIFDTGLPEPKQLQILVRFVVEK